MVSRCLLSCSVVALESGAVGCSVLTILDFPRSRLRTSGSTSIGFLRLVLGVESLCFLLVQVGCPLEVFLVR